MSIHPPGLGALEDRRFAAVLFDLDGTLIDSTPAVSRSWAEWARRRGLSEPPPDIPHGVPARQVLAQLVAASEVEAAFAELEAIETEQLEGITVLPGALRALGAVPPDRSAVVTSGTPPLAQARIAAVGLPVPPLLVTPDDVPLGKPDPAPFLFAAARLGVSPLDCLVVEDAVAGLTAARAAGCASLALTTTYPPAELAADAVIDRLDDVRFAVEGDSLRLHPA